MTTQQTQIIDNETGEILNNQTDTNQAPSKSTKRFVEEMVYLIHELDAVKESLKELKQQAKDQGYNPAWLFTVATAQATEKDAELEEKSNGILKILDEIKG